MAVVKEIKDMKEPYTKGVAEFWFNIGKDKNHRKELETLLRGVDEELIFNELARRYTSMARVICGIWGKEDFPEEPEVIEGVRNQFELMGTLVAEIRRRARV